MSVTTYANGFVGKKSKTKVNRFIMSAFGLLKKIKNMQ